jgi:hypothetical protein
MVGYQFAKMPYNNVVVEFFIPRNCSTTKKIHHIYALQAAECVVCKKKSLVSILLLPIGIEYQLLSVNREKRENQFEICFLL